MLAGASRVWRNELNPWTSDTLTLVPLARDPSICGAGFRGSSPPINTRYSIGYMLCANAGFISQLKTKVVLLIKLIQEFALEVKRLLSCLKYIIYPWRDSNTTSVINSSLTSQFQNMTPLGFSVAGIRRHAASTLEGSMNTVRPSYDPNEKPITSWGTKKRKTAVTIDKRDVGYMIQWLSWRSVSESMQYYDKECYNYEGDTSDCTAIVYCGAEHIWSAYTYAYASVTMWQMLRMTREIISN